jgi:hypothetical protein
LEKKMTTLALIATLVSLLALVIVATGILILSISGMLKSFADKSVGTISSTPSREPASANSHLRKSEAKMPSLATLYVVS